MDASVIHASLPIAWALGEKENLGYTRDVLRLLESREAIAAPVAGGERSPKQLPRCARVRP